MITTKRGRVLARTTRPHERTTDTHHTCSLPFCNRHGVSIVDRLPTDCPLAQRDDRAALLAMKDNAWRLRGEATATGADPADGTRSLARFGVCDSCADAMRLHPDVRYLRHRLRESELVADTCVKAAPAADRNGRPRQPLKVGAGTYRKRRRIAARNTHRSCEASRG